tara:strand:+ start:3915 stop:4241 length:327 start_codon:yes stop_codon:yes gene_type:complete
MNVLFIFLFLILITSVWFIRKDIKKLYKIIYEIRENMPDKLSEEEKKIEIKKKYYSSLKDNSSLDIKDKLTNKDLNEKNEFDEIMSKVVTDDKIRNKISNIYKKNKNK